MSHNHYLRLTWLDRCPVITAINDESGDMNVAFDHEHDASQPKSDTIPAIAKRLKARSEPWALIVDENYGEGSAREHAALQPRFYGMNPSSIKFKLGLNALQVVP